VFVLLQIAAAEEDVDRLTSSKASAQAEADEADAAAQQALETGHAEVAWGWQSVHMTRTVSHGRLFCCGFSGLSGVSQQVAVRLNAVQVMKLRRRFEELSSEVSCLTQQRELLLTQMADEQAEWEKRQQVRVQYTACRTHCKSNNEFTCVQLRSRGKQSSSFLELPASKLDVCRTKQAAGVLSAGHIGHSGST
jgi:hypothetical protein